MIKKTVLWRIPLLFGLVFSLNVSAQSIVEKVLPALQGCFSSFISSGKPKTILEELNQPGLKIKSLLFLPHKGWSAADQDSFLNVVSFDALPENLTYSIDFVFPSQKGNASSKEGSLTQFRDYVTGIGKRGKRLIVLSFRMGEAHYRYTHHIYWETSLKPPLDLDGAVAESVFNKLYEEVYGEGAEKMADLFLNAEKATPRLFDKSALNLDRLFFHEREEDLRAFVLSAVENPKEQSEGVEEGGTTPFLISRKIDKRIRYQILSASTLEEVKAIPPDQIKALTNEELTALFNSEEKIQVLDIRLIAPDLQTELLATSPLWKQSVTAYQIAQLDVTAKNIQYVFVPEFKYYTYRPADTIPLSLLSDAQIMEMNRDTFLRDVFLAGDTSLPSIISWEVSDFIRSTKHKFRTAGPEKIMESSLPDKMYAVIAENLGFPSDFDSLTARERRELFKKEMEMMMSGQLTLEIIQAVIKENTAGNHQWF